MNTKINAAILSVLKTFGDKYFIEGEVNKSKVIKDLDNYEPELLEKFLKNETIKSNFTIEIDGNVVVLVNKLIEMFELDEYWEKSFTKYSKKIGLTAGGKFIDENEDVVLDFPYKDTILKASMSKEDTDQDDLRPDEPFLNEVIAKEEIDVLLDKKILVNAKKYDENGVREVDRFDENDNLIIKGNNLLALHTIKERYAGKVKLIYIDPPYNTEDDSFKYNDQFNHSTWLIFMKNRLDIAKEFLREDGFLFIQINDKEQAYLKVLCDEIMGSDNFLTNICVKMSHLSGPKMAHKEKKIPKIKEFILVYAKNRSNVKFNPEYIPVSWDEAFERYNSFLIKKGYDDDNCHKWEVITLNEALKRNNIDRNSNEEVEKFKIRNAHLIFRTARNRSFDFTKYPKDKFTKIKKDGDSYFFIYKGEEVLFASSKIKEINGVKTPVAPVGDIWTDIGINNLSNEGGVSLRFGKKPEQLIKRIINMTTKSNDIVLDFFMGSATTQAVAHKMNRRYIGIEQMDYINTISVPRLQKVIEGEQGGISKNVGWQGGGSFVYVELMEKNKEFIDMIRKAKTQTELNEIFESILEKGEIDFRVDLEKRKSILHELSLEEQKKLLFKIIDKNQLYYNYSDIDDKDVRKLLTDNDYKFNKNFYGDESGEN